jgi:hypothetical protein
MVQPVSVLKQTTSKVARSGASSLKFGGGVPAAPLLTSAEKALEKELDRLAQGNKPGFLVRSRYVLTEKTLKARAQFNLTQEPDHLNPFLPYRELLVRTSQTKALQTYDQLVQKILNQAEFYEVASPNKIKAKLQEAYTGSQRTKNPVARFFLNTITIPIRVISHAVFQLGLWLHPVGISKFMNRLGKGMPGKAKEMKAEKIKDIFKDNVRPLQEASTRYIIASGIAQLLHRNPHYADQILEQAAKDRPLRFVVGDNKPLLVGGQAMPGLNVIFLNRPAMWKAIEQKKHISQHEFVHLLSENNGMNTLGFLSDTQKKEFKASRKALKHQFRTQDKSWLGGFKCILPFKSVQANSTGIRSYGFFNNMEFLTVSLDTFMQDPAKLCTTKAGQKLYDIYKESFGLDPLRDYGIIA